MNKSHYKKKIGSREEVYVGIALKTNGGLFKKDIIQKNTNGKYSYVSKKLSEIAKERNVFSNYRKRKTRANKVSINVNTNAPLQPNKLTKKNVSFSLNQNQYKTIYYPELKGVNLERLRNNNLEEEDEEDEDDEEEIQHTPQNFKIEDISQLNL
jgi:hypothetical protein